VSGAKPLRGDLHGSYRIRTGDYRVVFTVSADGQTVVIWKIGYRGSIYE
jgi:mRNA-degrading endonuclease RelE of RelBE toxin-antitoxin system